MFKKENFDVYIRRQWAEKGFEFAAGERVGISIDELVRHSAERNASVATPYLELWIGILDEFISWQISLVTIFYSRRKDKVRIFNNFEKSIFLILMKIIADSIAMRHLILLGFDVSARILLRSTAEYTELYVAILNDPDLADEFAKTDVPEECKRFWDKHIAGGSIRKKMREAWQEIFDENQSDAANWFGKWGHSWNDQLSSISHPSFAGGLFSAIPFKTRHSDENWLGIWGDKSEGSVSTIDIYASYMFPVFLLCRGFPFEDYDDYISGKIKFDEENEMHRHVKYGRDILASLILSLSKESNRDHIYPSYDLSIFE